MTDSADVTCDAIREAVTIHVHEIASEYARARHDWYLLGLTSIMTYGARRLGARGRASSVC